MKILRFNARLPQPRISQSLTDPLGAATRLSKMDKVITRKYKQLRTRALELFRTIPNSQANAESSGLYFYDFSSARCFSFHLFFNNRQHFPCSSRKPFRKIVDLCFGQICHHMLLSAFMLTDITTPPPLS